MPQRAGGTKSRNGCITCKHALFSLKKRTILTGQQTQTRQMQRRKTRMQPVHQARIQMRRLQRRIPETALRTEEPMSSTEDTKHQSRATSSTCPRYQRIAPIRALLRHAGQPRPVRLLSVRLLESVASPVESSQHYCSTGGYGR